MPSRIRCFMLIPTDLVEVSLRRYASSRDGVPKCPRIEARYPGAEEINYEVHNVEISIGMETGTVESSLDGDSTQRTVDLDDPRWPAFCPCGFKFRPEDAKQENRSRLHDRSDGGPRTTIWDAPVGALYNARHFNDVDSHTRNGPGMSLTCKTPAGVWMIDGPASNGPGWSRAGTPPDVVVQPSIGIGHPQRMHGWLGGPSHDEPGWLVVDSP